MADDVLAPFVLENVKGLKSDEKKGSGAYGAVYKVTVKGVVCIDKRLHDILVNPEVPPRQRLLLRDKFREECIILSKLRHPHIVHFVGVRYGPSPSDLSLVMECLHTDLAKFLEEHQGKGVDIPLSIKLSILLDVSYGLLYLHTLTPPVIHRDLSANNILLSADGLQAKIADLGVSKLLDLQMQTKIAQTKVPGSQNYMPPEALTENPHYGLELDIFSFGHLMLYTATQEFPGVHEVALTPADLHQGTVQIVKRKKAIDQMGGEQHCLHPLVLQCLQDKPEQRPSTIRLNESLKEQCTMHPRRVAEVLQFSGESEKVAEETDAVWRSMVDKLEGENRKLSMDVGVLQRDKKSLEKSMDAVDARNEELEACAQKLKVRLDKMTQKEEWAQWVAEDSRMTYQKCQKLETENMQLSEQMKKMNRRLEQEKEALQNQVQISKTEAQLYKEDFESERHDREQAHKKIAYLARQHAEEAERLETEQLRMQEQRNKVLAELEDRNKKYKKQVASLKDQVAELTKHNEDLTQEMDRVRMELVKVKSGKPKIKPPDTDDHSKLAELEVPNWELSKERDKLFRELDKTRKELAKEKKAEAEKPKDAEKGRKEKQSDKGATSPEPIEVSKTNIAEREHLYEELRRETSQSPLTFPVHDLPMASHPEQLDNQQPPPPRPPKPSPSPLTMSPSGSRICRQLPPPHLGAPEIPPQAHACPQNEHSTDQHSLSAVLPRVDSQIQQNPEPFEVRESYSWTYLDQNLDSIIHTESVATEVGDESGHRLTMQHVPYDPNLTCPLCNKRFRIGEILKYRVHVNQQCVGSQEVITDV